MASTKEETRCTFRMFHRRDLLYLAQFLLEHFQLKTVGVTIGNPSIVQICLQSFQLKRANPQAWKDVFGNRPQMPLPYLPVE